MHSTVDSHHIPVQLFQNFNKSRVSCVLSSPLWHRVTAKVIEKAAKVSIGDFFLLIVRNNMSC